MLAAGDLVSIDCGAILDGWHGDSAVTFGVGALIPADEALSRRHPGVDGGRHRRDGARQPADRRLARDRGRHARRRGALRPQVRHRRRLRRARHRPARCTWIRSCPTRARRAAGRYLAAGSVLAIEPMLTLGTTKTIGARRRVDRRHRRRVARRALGAHRRRHRRRAADPHRCPPDDLN